VWRGENVVVGGWCQNRMERGMRLLGEDEM
jgi:hypothetical protein